MNNLGRNQKIAILSVALLLGVAIGSWNKFPRNESVTENPEQNSGAPQTSGSPHVPDVGRDETPAKGLENSPQITDGRPAESTQEDSGTRVFVGNGVLLVPLRSNDGFLGYEVIQAGDDERFETGDILYAINGIELEDSAAGGELLSAWLQDPSSQIEIRNESE